MILEIVFYTVALVLGIKVSIQEGMIFEGLGVYAQEQLDKGKVIFKPLLLCHWCAPSIYSLVGFMIYFLVHGFTFKYLFLYPVIVGISSFLAGFLWELLELVITTKAYYETGNELMSEGEEGYIGREELYN